MSYERQGAQVFAASELGSRIQPWWNVREITPGGETGPLQRYPRRFAHPVSGGAARPVATLYGRQIGPHGAEGPIEALGNAAAASVIPLHAKVMAGAAAAYLAYVVATKPIKQNPGRKGMDSTDTKDVFDPEVVELCQIMNDLPGIETIESCGGHGRRSLQIWFRVDQGDHRGLFILARSLDRRYFKHGAQWSLTVSGADAPIDPLPILFLIESKDVGKEAYDQAQDLVENIQRTIHNKVFMKTYGLQRKRERR